MQQNKQRFIATNDARIRATAIVSSPHKIGGCDTLDILFLRNHKQTEHDA
jgi:hypothetical protein